MGTTARTVALAIVSMFALSACAGSPGRERRKEPVAIDGWRRSESGALAIYTSAPDEAARRALRQMGRFVDVVSQLAHGHPFRPSRRVDVFIFGSREQYRRFAPEFVAGHAGRGDDEIVVGLSIEQAFQSTETLYHELTHVVLHGDTSRSFPSWYHEGLAVFFGTSVQRGDVLTVGALPSRAVREIRAKRRIPLRRLLSSPLWGQSDIALFYADAWAFVHFGLLSESMGGRDHQKAFQRYVDRVSRGQPWEPSFREAFGADPEAIDEEYGRHREHLAETAVQMLANVSLSFEGPEVAFEPVGRIEIARELAQLGLEGFRSGSESAGELFEVILAAEPNDTEAIYGGVRAFARTGDLERADALWAQLGEARRSGAGAWQASADLELAHAEALGSRVESERRRAHLDRSLAAYRRVLEGSPQRLSALAGLGRALVMADEEDPAEGIAALEGAVSLAPEWPDLRLDLAELMIRGDAASDARPHLDYVIEAYPGTDFSRRAKRLRRELD